MTGFDVSDSETRKVLKAVDADGDGKIGMDDFLATVGAMKDQYLIEQYQRVKKKMMEDQGKEL